MLEDEFEALCLVSPARGTNAGNRITVVKHGVALGTIAPVGLGIPRFGNVVGQHERESLSDMAAARRAMSFVRITVIKHGVTFLAVSPVLLQRSQRGRQAG